MMTDMGDPGLIHQTHTHKKREQEIKNMIVVVPGMVERCSGMCYNTRITWQKIKFLSPVMNLFQKIM